MATSPAPSDSVAPSDLAASAAAAGPTPVLVHRPVRAFPRPLPATELKLAAPPAVGWAASNLAAWLQYLVPLVGSGGSIGFLFAVPGPRPVWLVVLVTGLAGASVLAGLGLRLVEHRATGRARHRERSRYLAHLRQVAAAADHLAAAQLAVAGTSTPIRQRSGPRSPGPTASGSAARPTPTSSRCGSGGVRSPSPPLSGSTSPSTRSWSTTPACSRRRRRSLAGRPGSQAPRWPFRSATSASLP